MQAPESKGTSFSYSGLFRSAATNDGQCDERRPLCGNCDKHYSNIEKCDFAGQPENSASDEAFISAARPARKLLKKDKHIRDYLYRQDTLVYPPPESLGSGIDPFMSHVESKVPEVQLFMHHCKQWSSSFDHTSNLAI